MATVKLQYDINLGLRPLSPAEAQRVGDIELYSGELEMLGMEVDSDVSSTGVSKITRTVTLKTTTLGDSLWKTEDELKAATRGLYREILNLKYPGLVQAQEPVVTL